MGGDVEEVEEFLRIPRGGGGRVEAEGKGCCCCCESSCMIV